MFNIFNRIKSLWIAPTPAVLALCLLFLFALFTPPSARADGAEEYSAGTPRGDFSVNGNGAAHYSVPIVVPPGRQGAQPDLALNYNSQTGNGILGVGWSLSGLSAIGRCPPRKSDTDFRGGVGYYSGDRFCLDGQMLIAVKGTYGAHGTEYRTERESWTRIFSFYDADGGKSCNGGPCYFKATARDGSQLQFGATTGSSGSRAVLESGMVRVWAINEAADRNGNAVRVTYDQITSEKNYYPKTIQYTFNPNAGFNTARRAVDFQYDTERPDDIIAYNNGVGVKTSRRMKSIVTKLDGKTVNTYEIEYRPSRDTRRSLVGAIKFCGASGQCLNPIRVDYRASGEKGRKFKAGTSSNLTHGSYGHPKRWKTIDVDGDGLTDLVDIGPNSKKKDALYFSFRSNRSSFSYLNSDDLGDYVKWNKSNRRSYPALDVDGDGLLDIVRIRKDDGKARANAYLSQGNGKFHSPCSSTKMGDWHDANQFYHDNWLPMDVNNDGRTDLLKMYEPPNSNCTEGQLYLATEKGCFEYASSPGWCGSDRGDGTRADESSQFFVIDANGDRIPDVLKIYKNGSNAHALVYKGTGNTDQPLTGHSFRTTLGEWQDLGSAEQHRYLPMDYNGDGLPDLVEIYKATDADRTIVQVYTNTGNAFVKRAPVSVAFWQDVNGPKADRFIPADYDGDGRTDLLRVFYFDRDYFFFDAEGTRVQVIKGRADGLKPPNIQYAQKLGGWTDDQDFIAMDSNGDGMVDLLRVTPTGTSKNLVTILPFVNEPAPDLATRITDGLNGWVEITHWTLTLSDSLYTSMNPPDDLKDAREAILPLNVVAYHTLADGLNNKYAFRHTYAGAFVSRTRGWLGFARTALQDRQTHIEERNTYYQNFPLIGTIITRDRVLEDINGDELRTLGQSQTIWDHRKQSNGVYHAYKKQDIQNHFDKGSLDYSLSRTYVYDADFRRVEHIHDHGASDLKNDSLMICYDYPSGESTDWKTAFPTTMRIQKKTECDYDGTKWVPEIDLRLERYEYDDRMNLKTSYAYDDSVQPQNSAASWVKTSMAYDAAGNATAVTDPNGSKLSIQFDASGVYPLRTCSPPIKKRDPGQSGQGELETDFSDECKNNTGADRANYYVLSSAYTYDERFGLMTSSTNESGTVTNQIPADGIDEFGRIVKVQGLDPVAGVLKDIQTVTYNRQTPGMVVESRFRGDWNQSNTADWLYEKITYDGMARPRQTATRPLDSGVNAGQEVLTANTFDKAGRPLRETMPYFRKDTDKAAHVWRYYNDAGRPSSIVGPAKKPSTNKKLTITYASRRMTRSFPDPRDTTGGAQYVSSTAWSNSRGRVTQTQSPSLTADITGYTYDSLGRRKTITDGKKQKTTITYNSLGRVTSIEKPELGTITNEYDPAGNVIRQTQGQRVTTIVYDSIGRILTTTSVIDGKQETGVVTTSYYDRGANGAGTLSNVVQSRAAYQYEYDAIGQLTLARVRLDVNGDGSQETYDSRYTYDALGRILTLRYPDDSTTGFTYNKDGSLAEASRTAAGSSERKPVVTYGDYNAASQPGTIASANGVTTNFTYDPIGRLNTTRVIRGPPQNPTAVYRDFQYTWTLSDNLWKIQDRRTSPATNLSETLTYDEMGRLKTANGPYPDSTFAYDVNGNVTQKNGYAFVYESGKSNQLYYGCPDTCSGKSYSTAPYQAKYDGAGNQVAQRNLRENTNGTLQADDDFTQYVYDARQQLKAVRAKGKTTDTFYYGADSRLLIREDKVADVTSFYIAPYYIVTRRGTGDFSYTRYVPGSTGPVAALTKSGDGATPASTGWRSYLNLSRIVPLFVSPLSLLFLLSGYTFLLGAMMLVRAPSGTWRGRLRRRFDRGMIRMLPAGHRPFLVRRRERPADAAFYARPGRSFTALGLSVVFCFTVMHPGDLAGDPGTWPGGGDGYPADETVAYFHHDQVNSVNLVTNQAGDIASEVSYRPYGEVDAAHSSGADDFRPKFSSREFIRNSGQYYFYARYLDPVVGRFTAPDPANQYASPYVYAGDDPYARIDPDGEFAVLIAALVVGAVVGAYLGGAAANKSLNPAHWNWSSGKTWAGLFIGGALGVGVVATGGALAGAAPVAGVSAGAIAWTSLDVALLTYDSYQFSQEQTVVNGVFVALDLIPFAGLLGRGAHALSGAAHGGETTAEVAGHAAEAEEHAGEALEHGEGGGGSCSFSFPDETPVHTDQGTRPIQDIAAGDRVLAYDEASNEQSLHAVEQLYQRTAAGVVTIAVGDETIAATPEHPFYVIGRGWVEAQDLQPGDALRDRASEGVAVTDVSSRQGAVRVRNFSVHTARTYYVGERGYLVHNPECPMYDDGNITPKRDKYGRLKTVDAFLHKNYLDTGTRTTEKTIRYRKAVGKAGDETGHVIAKRLGGPGHLEDFVFPQAKAMNNGRWKKFEAELYQKVQNTNGYVRVKVQFEYRTVRTKRPYRITYSTYIGGATTSKKIALPKKVFGNVQPR